MHIQEDAMQPKYLRESDLVNRPATDTRPARIGRCNISAATLRRWVSAGHFPPPVRLGPHAVAWRIEDLERWDAERIQGAAQ